MIRPVTAGDAEQICSIYNNYITGTLITFEENPVSVEERSARTQNVIKTYQ